MVAGGGLGVVRLWARELGVVQEHFLHRCSRSEPSGVGSCLYAWLIAPLQRKNGWRLAEEAGHESLDRIHRMLSRIEWDADEVLDDVREYVVENLGEQDAVLIDETGFLKKGTRSAGCSCSTPARPGGRRTVR